MLIPPEKIYQKSLHPYKWDEGLKLSAVPPKFIKLMHSSGYGHNVIADILPF